MNAFDNTDIFKKNPFIFVMGTTASGKSAWALQLAEKHQGVIINCDSVQFYNHVQIGSAAPKADDLKRVPHYLYSYVKPPHEITAMEFLKDFSQVLITIPPKIPIFVVGGTGFYFQALEKGMYEVEPVSDQIKLEILEQLKTNRGVQKLYEELCLVDPLSAQKISINDHYRLGRALELIRSQGGKTLTEIRQSFEKSQNPFPGRYKKVMPYFNKEILAERILLRTQDMIQRGLIDEVKCLLNQNLEMWAPMQSVGYKETVSFIKNNANFARSDLIEEISLRTRQLAKKQRTWFQRVPDVLKFEVGSLDQKIVEEVIIDFIENF